MRLQCAVICLCLLPAAPLVVQAQCRDAQAYEIQTVAYPEDAPANAVLDKRTGLQWRRCEEGQRWDGSVCQGQSQQFSHEQALRHTGAMVAWQLPDVKQLGSLALRSCRFPALDAAAFLQGPVSAVYWSSTPFAASAGYAWSLDVDTGQVGYIARRAIAGLRLVRR